jgi:hypothetical protein
MSDFYFCEPGSAPSRTAVGGDLVLEKYEFKQAFSYKHENDYLQRPASHRWSENSEQLSARTCQQRSQRRAVTLAQGDAVQGTNRLDIPERS